MVRRYLLLAALAVAGRAAAQQTAADRRSEAYEASVSQDGLRRDAASVRAELILIRNQMRQLMPDDVATVDRAIAQMDSLSHDEMERVVQTLRGVSRPEGLGGQAQALAAVLKDQGAISVSLKRLAIGLDARQSMEGVSAELSALLGRQVNARDELARLARREQTPDRLRDRDRERYDAVNTDQQSVSEDLKLLLPRIERVAGTLTGDAQPKFAQAVEVARTGKLAELADHAAAQTAQGPFDQATGSQGQIAALLVGMEQALAGAARPADRLAALENRLKQTLAQQQAVAQTIAGFHERQSVEHETRRMQATISDQIAGLRAELQPLNAQAAADLQAAQEAAEQASLHYEHMWEERPEAQQSTRDAAAGLAAALQAVDKQAAALPARTPITPAQLDTALAALQSDVAQAATAAQAPATADPQKGLREQVDELQRRALPVSSEAAQDLDNAAAQLRQPGPAARQAAAQQLAKAAQTLAQQQAARDLAQAQNDAAGVKPGQAQTGGKAAQSAFARPAQAMEAARQTPEQQAMAALPGKPGNDPGKRQGEGGTAQGQGNGGGGKSGDFLAGAGASAEPMEPVSGLTPQDRAAVTQLQTEKPPAEFVSEVQQYYKNIADGAGL